LRPDLNLAQLDNFPEKFRFGAHGKLTQTLHFCKIACWRMPERPTVSNTGE